MPSWVWPGHGAAGGPGSALSGCTWSAPSRLPQPCATSVGREVTALVVLNGAVQPRSPLARWQPGGAVPEGPAAPHLLSSELSPARGGPRGRQAGLRSSSLAQQLRPKPGDVHGHRPPPGGFGPGLATRDSGRARGSEGQEAASPPEARAAHTSGWPWVWPAWHTAGAHSRAGQGGHAVGRGVSSRTRSRGSGGRSV